MSGRTARHDPDRQFDVVVVGLGLGALAAALTVARAGLTVCIAGPETRIGGQVTTQLTSPLDEHPLIEETGCTATYRAFRDGIRRQYGRVANPGGGWVSRLCFEPRVGEIVLQEMLAAYVESETVTVLTEATLISVERSDALIRAVTVSRAGVPIRLGGDVFIDASETGDLLPLAGAQWVVGSEGADAFGEPHALPGGPDPRAEQSCTVVAALVRDAEPGPVGPAPAGYEHLRDHQPFSLTLSNDAGHSHTYPFFDDSEPPGSFWSYRRVRASSLVGGAETAIINWHGNDYFGAALTADPRRVYAEARELTLAFVHWLRTECPRDDGDAEKGYPELRLAPDVAGTVDGLGESPYVRESRRLASARPVTEHDLAPRAGHARSTHFDDAVGIAWYHADLHPRVGGHASVYAPTAPFQIPLRALLADLAHDAAAPVNLLAGAKNLAATQVAAAAYRVHPGEWAVGEAAGAIAAHAVSHGVTPADAAASGPDRIAVQIALLRGGAPLVWATDLPADHPAFVAGSLLAAYGGWDSSRLSSLAVRPDEPADADARAALVAAAERLADVAGTPPGRLGSADSSSWAADALALAAPIVAAIDTASHLDHHGLENHE